MGELAERYQIDLIGGDTVSTNDSLVITITVTGEVEKGRHLLRSQANFVQSGTITSRTCFLNTSTISAL